MRNLTRNKYLLIKYANVIANNKTQYGESTFVYSDIKELKVLASPENTTVSYEEYGLDIDRTLKLLIPKNKADDFKKDTIVFVGVEPNKLKTNFNYRVLKESFISINEACVVLKKISGKDDR